MTSPSSTPAAVQKVTVQPDHHEHAINSPTTSKYERCCTVSGEKLRFSIAPLPSFPAGTYHFSSSEEVHFQITGDAILLTVESGVPRDEDVTIKEGQMFILPARIPKRYKQQGQEERGPCTKASADTLPSNSVNEACESVPSNSTAADGASAFDAKAQGNAASPLAFVLDRLRSKEGDTLIRSSADSQWVVETAVTDAVTATEEACSSAASSAVPIDADTLLSKPFSVADRIARLAQRDDAVRVHNGEFVIDLVGGNTRTPALPIETESWVWCVRGSLTVNESILLAEGECAIVPHRLENLHLSDDAAAFVAYVADSDF